MVLNRKVISHFSLKEILPSSVSDTCNGQAWGRSSIGLHEIHHHMKLELPYGSYHRVGGTYSGRGKSRMMMIQKE